MQGLKYAIDHAELIVFDLDGTIVYLDVDWSAVKEEISGYFFNKYGINESFSPMQPAIQRLVDRFGYSIKNPICDIIRKHESAAIPTSVANEFVIQLINSISLEKKLAVFSINLHETIEQALKKEGIFYKFDYIVGFEDVIHLKPDPEGLKQILMYFKTDSSKALYIGDKDIDVKAGKAANVKTYNISTNILY
jgi:phosphoglycolate phosphatase